MKSAIKITNLSKHYKIGNVAYKRLDSLISDLKKWWIPPKQSSVHQALSNINLEVKQGESIGIIGQNGAGKSTLLKIISGITSPTQGKIRICGRVSSLLEIGTGFHPELTARENIFLNGVLLGMQRSEIKNKFNEIISYAGIYDFVDTPVKKFSSGMYIRLGFAIAVQLRSDILILDEVLAVGDREFQKKCFNTMSDIMNSKARTILFVSHNLSAVSEMCERSILLHQGKILADGPTRDIIERYKGKEKAKTFVEFKKEKNNPFGNFERAEIIVDGKLSAGVIEKKDQCVLKLNYQVSTQTTSIIPFVGLYNSDGILVWLDKFFELEKNYSYKKARRISVLIPFERLIPDDYEIEIGLGIPSLTNFIGLDTVVFYKNALKITLVDTHDSVKYTSQLGILSDRGEWKENEILQNN